MNEWTVFWTEPKTGKRHCRDFPDKETAVSFLATELIRKGVREYEARECVEKLPKTPQRGRRA